MKIAPIAQLAFIGIAATAVYTFVTVARHAEARRACVPLCAMHPAYAAMSRTAPDFELRDMRGGFQIGLCGEQGSACIGQFFTGDRTGFFQRFTTTQIQFGTLHIGLCRQ